MHEHGLAAWQAAPSGQLLMLPDGEQAVALSVMGAAGPVDAGNAQGLRLLRAARPAQGALLEAMRAIHLGQRPDNPCLCDILASDELSRHRKPVDTALLRFWARAAASEPHVRPGRSGDRGPIFFPRHSRYTTGPR